MRTCPAGGGSPPPAGPSGASGTVTRPDLGSGDTGFDSPVPDVAAEIHEAGHDRLIAAWTGHNQRKGDRTPEEVGFRLLRRPRRPPALPSLSLGLAPNRAPESWRDYLFWDACWDPA